MDNIVSCENGVYGAFHSTCPTTCQWYESCKVYTKTPNPENARKIPNSVNFEKNHFRKPTFDKPTKEEVPAEEKAFTELASVLHYLVNLDNNTALAIIDIIRNPSASQAEIARKRGVSRQRINTSLLHAVQRHPELAALFCTCVNKFTLLNNRYDHKDDATSGAIEEPFLPGLEA